MPTVQEWGRKESVIWPPRGFYYTYGATFLALVVTGFLVHVHFHFSLSPLEAYYLPYYIRTETAGVFRPTGMYQLVYITDGKSQSRIAMDADVAPGQTWQFSGKPLPLVLSDHDLGGLSVHFSGSAASIPEQWATCVAWPLDLC